ncbi:hypothetical protein Tco_1214826 [Tanacetum coccineum]
MVKNHNMYSFDMKTPSPAKGISEETNSAGSSIASEEKDEEVEIMVVAFSCQIPKKQSIKDNSTNSKQEETLTEPHNE